MNQLVTPPNGPQFTPHDNELIQHAYRELARTLSAGFWNRGKIRKAFDYANKAHYGTRRKSGEPYILHPLAVAQMLAEEMGIKDQVTIVCALLHDVVEDTEISLDDIEREFGPKEREIIKGLTKIKSADILAENYSAQAEYFRQIFLTIAKDIRVVLIKLADRLHNMRTLGAMKEVKMLKIASETQILYAPLANRLGLHQIKSEMEDLALKFSQPDVYEKIEARLERFKLEQQAYIDDFVESVRELLRRSGLRFKVKSRFKTVSSIYNKMQRQGVGFSEVYDLFAIRIILKPRARHEIAECWRAYSVISEKFTPNPKRLRDWITVPKENGYESLHVTVMGSGGRWVEVQIRTEDMDANAELGIAAHAKYKDGEMFEDNRWNEWIDKVRHILNDPELSDLEAVRSFRANLEPNNVFVFTPKGELYRMPTGASVLDLAYAIHTDIGDSAMGAKVDGTVVSLDYLLKPGDQVEVINSKKPRPSVEWLRMVKTPRAKEFIKRALAKQRRESIQKGREMFLWRAKKYNITEDHEVMKELLAFVMQPTKEDFYFALYQRQISADRIEKFIELKRNGNAVDTKYISQWEKKRQARLNTFEELGLSEDNLVLTSNEHLEEYALATCCKPMPGDSILGFLTGNKVTIHRTSCPKAIELMSNFGSRIIKAKWKEGGSHIDFMAGLKVVGLDKVGMLSELIQVLTYKMKLNIRKVTIESMDGMFEGVFIIYVKDIEELQAAVDRIVKLPSVFSVSRVDSDYVPFQDGPPQSSTGKASSLAT